MKFLIAQLTVAVSLIVAPAALADHSPKKMMRNFKAFSQLGMTGQLGSFSVNVSKFGAMPKGAPTTVDTENYQKMLADKFNLAAIVIKGDDIVYERYKTNKGFDSNTPMLGMSMSKTAVGAAVGALLCDGKIKSLDDDAGSYSKTLKASPYATIKIRNILQMNSGVSPLGRGDEKRFNRKSRGVEKFAGKASVRGALAFYKEPARDQNSQMNYHSTDTLALSVLVEEIAGAPLADVFYENVYKKFGQDGYMHWTADGDGTTVSYSDLVMTARDWGQFGKFLMAEKKAKTCLGSFFNEGVENAVATGKKNGSRYGYQSWVFDVNGKPAMVLQGHGGQFTVLDETTDTVLLVMSLNEDYKAGNLFNSIHKIAEKLN